MLKLLLRLATSPIRAVWFEARTRRLEQENTELKKELKAALKLALTDAVTGAMNRHAFNRKLDELGVVIPTKPGLHPRRHQRPTCNIAILVLDLSGFGNINNEFGHPAGDEALAAVLTAIEQSIRKTDHVYRIGGDEFAVVLEDVNCAEATIVAKRIIANIEAILDWELTGRIGGAVWNVKSHPNTEPMDVYAFADTLERELRAQHQNGRTNVQDYEP
jgi:diguanylate cyclase (GGDEF)-like protein